jgi:hypothetical protein
MVRPAVRVGLYMAPQAAKKAKAAAMQSAPHSRRLRVDAAFGIRGSLESAPQFPSPPGSRLGGLLRQWNLCAPRRLYAARYMMEAAELGNQQSRRMAARSHARAAFLCLRLPCAPGKYRANSAYNPRWLRERRFSTSSGFARLSRHMQEYATRFQPSSPTCASPREASQWHPRELFSSIRLIQAEKPPSPFFLTRTRPSLV